MSDSVRKTLAKIRTLTEILLWIYSLPQLTGTLAVDDLPSINPLPNDGILDLTKLKAIADDKINVSKMVICFDRIKNILGKGENAD